MAYPPLQPGEIRVFVLHPGLPGSPLSGDLHVNHVDHLEKYYEAISYAWGDLEYDAEGRPILHHEVLVQGHGRVPIAEFLFEALQQFRRGDKARPLWADSICINQHSIPERSAQGAMMARIFGAATRVLVWLGVQVETDALAY
jgi:hypothetical protein